MSASIPFVRRTLLDLEEEPTSSSGPETTPNARTSSRSGEAERRHPSPGDAKQSEPMGDRPLQLSLAINDSEVCEALEQYADDEQRQAFALAALKIGVTAIQVARGRLDAEVIQRESSRLLEAVSNRLQQHATQVNDRVQGQLREYFDPESGRLNERIQRLVSRDGEIEQVMRRLVGGDDSELSKTLLSHFGVNSPLMKQLSPTESQGLLAALRCLVEEQLRSQRERVLQEFSLDNPQSALTRLVAELTRNHGLLQRDLHAKIDDVVKEFSLDQESSALSRLVRNVDTAQRTITQEFSLDNPQSAFSRLNHMLLHTQGAIQGHLTLDDENSALARLKRELLGILKDHSRENGEFREEVKSALATLVARRDEARAGTRHGIQFEDALGQFLLSELQPAGHVVTNLSTRVGLIKNCKVGDFVIEWSAESHASGARIIVEAKEDASYQLTHALEELQIARKNRDAQIGLFVFSSKTVPAGLDPFARYGDDLVVIWNAEDAATDVYLRAALTTARALCIRASRASKDTTDFDSIQRAILEIEKRSTSLDDIRRSAETVQSAGQKIVDRVQQTQRALQQQVDILHRQVQQWIQHHAESHPA